MILRIKENTQQAKAFAEYIKTLSFVEIIDEEKETVISKEQFLEDIKTSLKEIKEGKTKPLKDLLNGK
jgi:hypothetical protein